MHASTLSLSAPACTRLQLGACEQFRRTALLAPARHQVQGGTKSLVCRYTELQVYEVLINTAVSLGEAAREAAPVFEVVAAFGYSSIAAQEAGHTRLMTLHLSRSEDVVW